MVVTHWVWEVDGCHLLGLGGDGFHLLGLGGDGCHLFGLGG